MTTKRRVHQAGAGVWPRRTRGRGAIGGGRDWLTAVCGGWSCGSGGMIRGGVCGPGGGRGAGDANVGVEGSGIWVGLERPGASAGLTGSGAPAAAG
eukprot:4573978-Pleurochrysis_carterae.AAC.1